MPENEYNLSTLWSCFLHFLKYLIFEDGYWFFFFLVCLQVGIDAYSWLHKGGNCSSIFNNFCCNFGMFCFSMYKKCVNFCFKYAAYSCSMELCLNTNSQKKSRYLDYFMHRINLLRHYNTTPVVVFDGGNFPSKSATEHERDRHVTQHRMHFCTLHTLNFLR